MGSWWHSKKTVVEDCLALDVRVLARQGNLADGSISTQSWTNGSSVGVRVEGNQCTLSYTQGGDSRQQTIPLDYTPCNYGGERAWFRCPKCRWRCAQLHLWSSGFYCRKCYQLPYYSQQCGEIDRMIHRKHKLERKMEKPRLRKPTRDRLRQEWATLDMAIEDAIFGRFP